VTSYFDPAHTFVAHYNHGFRKANRFPFTSPPSKQQAEWMKRFTPTDPNVGFSLSCDPIN
jgi:hypothetical protein